MRRTRICDHETGFGSLKYARKRNLLLCVAGGTPAIITETLWALSEKHNVRVDEIRVITTKEGRDKLLTGKIGSRGAPDESLLDSERGQFYRFQKDYPKNAEIKFDPNSLYILTNKDTGVPSPRDSEDERLQDILNDEDNRKAANQICEIVRELAADEGICIHASIAGGRKTMGLYLMAAMQLFGRNDDRISHVLVSKEAEFGAPKFFYKPPHAEPILDPRGQPKTRADGTALTTEDIQIHLADIPFVRLSGIGSTILRERVESYESVVDQAQENLERFNLNYSLASDEVRIGTRAVRLTPSDHLVYVMFGCLRKLNRGQDGFVRVDEIPLEDFDAVCRLISKARGNERGYRDFFILREGALESLNYAFYRNRHPGVSAEDALAIVKKTLSDSISAIKVALRKASVNEDYAITNSNRNKKKLEPSYGLKLEPDRIKFS